MSKVFNSNSVAVAIPIYKDSFTELEEFSFYHNINILEKRDIFLLGPKRLEKYLIKLVSKIQNGYLTIVDDSFFDNSIRGNTRLMMSLKLYENYIDYNYLLICHFDAIVFQDNLNYWISKSFDYIGAPRFKSEDNDTIDLAYANNGGLCLRKVDTCLRVLNKINCRYSKLTSVWKLKDKFREKVRYLWFHGLIYNYKFKLYRPIIHEDLFWSFCVPEKYKWFKNAPFEEARYFSFEAKPKLLFEMANNNYPFGIHGWWKYDKEFCTKLVQKKFPDIIVPDINKNSK